MARSRLAAAIVKRMSLSVLRFSTAGQLYRTQQKRCKLIRKRSQSAGFKGQILFQVREGIPPLVFGKFMILCWLLTLTFDKCLKHCVYSTSRDPRGVTRQVHLVSSRPNFILHIIHFAFVTNTSVGSIALVNCIPKIGKPGCNGRVHLPTILFYDFHSGHTAPVLMLKENPIPWTASLAGIARGAPTLLRPIQADQLHRIGRETFSRGMSLGSEHYLLTTRCGYRVFELKIKDARLHFCSHSNE